MRRGTPLPPPPSSPLLQEDESLDQEDTLTPDDEEDDGDEIEGLVVPHLEEEQQEEDTSPLHNSPHERETTSRLEEEHEQEYDEPVLEHHGAYIVRNIASFLTLSDVASIASLGEGDWTPGESWAVGTTWAASVLTPPTPAIVAVSPTDPPTVDDHVHHHSQRYHLHHHEHVPDLQELERDEQDEDDDDDDNEFWEDRLQQRRRKWAQERLAAAVFSHPRPLRSYCLEAYEAARSIRQQQHHVSSSFQANAEQEQPETLREAPLATVRHHHHHRQRRRRNFNRRVNILLVPIDAFFSSTPVSVMFDIIDFVIETSKDTTFAAFKISVTSIDALISTIITLIQKVWNALTNFNPFELLDAFISIQFNAMGKTSEVLVSGIQSVATGVGSASNFALQRLSRGGSAAHAPQQQAPHRTGSPSSSFAGNASGLRRARTSAGNLLNKKLLRKLSSINSAAEVVSYKEVHDDTGGLSKEAKKRVHRMMHYDVSLRPFVATVVLPVPPRERKMSMFENVDFPSTRSTDPSYERQVTVNEEEAAVSPNSSGGDSPFMCTPQSFPPTPSSRRLVMARGSRYVEDVVFLARDQLRVHDALESANERTRAMANALREGKRLAVFNADDAASGIALTCGQHVATKVGNMLYCSTRSMVPVLRNCFVYFEVTIMPRPVGNMIMQASMATLSIGLSTLEMPLNTLVGAWKGSVGLCTTGQILTAGQWCSPVDPSQSAYGDNATVGCLVCLDDGTAFETWEGLMVTAAVTFSVNGRVVSPPVSSMPMVGSIGLDGSSAGPESVLLDPFQHARRLPAPPALSSTIPLLVPAEEELYATVSLHSPATSVMCRFSAEDVVATDRAHIGAPIGVTVYAVDGSVVFEK